MSKKMHSFIVPLQPVYKVDCWKWLKKECFEGGWILLEEERNKEDILERPEQVGNKQSTLKTASCCLWASEQKENLSTNFTKHLYVVVYNIFWRYLFERHQTTGNFGYHWLSVGLYNIGVRVWLIRSNSTIRAVVSFDLCGVPVSLEDGWVLGRGRDRIVSINWILCDRTEILWGTFKPPMTPVRDQNRHLGLWWWIYSTCIFHQFH